MNKQEYRRYLASDAWRVRRVRIVDRANEHCEWCGRFCGRAPHDPAQWCGREDCEWCSFYFDSEGNNLGLEQQSLEVHHKTYERVGRERDEDLVALCWSCHDEVTDRMMTLNLLAKAGRIPRRRDMPTVAATSFWRTFLNAMAKLKRGDE